MCIFAGQVAQAISWVSNTNIFARRTSSTSQILVYSMKVASNDDVAMILPLPVPPSPPEDAVRFINLERYPTLFDDLKSGFPELMMPMAFSGGIPSAAAPPPPPPLVVHDVGAFEASFVPTLADFGRLDKRFTLPPQTWDRLPQYRDWGFAVFKLKGFRKGAEKTFHPMAFEFRTREPGAVFFPTVHVHDGTVHAEANFNHSLYCQVSPEIAARIGPPAGGPLMPMPFSMANAWEASSSSASGFAKPALSEGTIDPSARVFRRQVIGRARNADWWVS